MAKKRTVKRRRFARTVRKYSVIPWKTLLAGEKKLASYSFGTAGTLIGRTHGIAGTGSIAMNDYLIQNSQIVQGTGVNQRVGNKIKFTDLQLRLHFTLGAGDRVRVIVGKIAQPDIAQATSNDAVGTIVEALSPNFLFMPPTTGSILQPDYQLDPARRCTVLMDKMIYADQPGGAACYKRLVKNVNLNMIREYSNSASNAPIDGSWFLYMSCSNTASNYVFGTVTMKWTDQ